MWSLVFRLAMMGGVVLVMWNVWATFARALRHPGKPAALPPMTREEAAAREMVERAIRRLTSIELHLAELKDAEVWSAAERLSSSVRQLNEAVLADRARYRRARRHLGQILFGAEHVALRFAKLYGATSDPDARASFEKLLEDLAGTFERASSDYAKAGMDDLQVEADVLRQLLERAKR